MAIEAAELEAGVELDELIAEHVLGWSRPTGLRNGSRWICDDACDVWRDKTTGDELGFDEFRRAAYWIKPDGEFPNGIPPFSTEIAAAWSIVLKMRSESWWWQVQSRHGKDGDWEAWCDHASDPEATRSICWGAPTAELAICRAALAAVQAAV